MKRFFALLILTATLTASSSFAYYYKESHHHHHYPKYHHHYYHDDDVYIEIDDTGAVVAAAIGGVVLGAVATDIAHSCSPVQVNSNIQKADKLGESLINDKRFKDQKNFNRHLAVVLDMKDEKKRLSGYFSLVSVNSARDIAYFVGARKEDYKNYESELIKNTNLDPTLANEVVARLIKTMKAN